jgi:two-component system chemotaxis response regulator CheY
MPFEPPLNLHTVHTSEQPGAVWLAHAKNCERVHMKCLVAEDDATCRALLHKILSKYGECDIVVDGREAVQAVKNARHKNRSYDLVCMDLRMPVMDGQEAIRQIRAEEAGAGALHTAKVIITTSLTDMGSITHALVGKCNAYLMKPIDTGKLLAELRELGLVK